MDQIWNYYILIIVKIDRYHFPCTFFYNVKLLISLVKSILCSDKFYRFPEVQKNISIELLNTNRDILIQVESEKYQLFYNSLFYQRTNVPTFVVWLWFSLLYSDFSFE